MFRTARVLLAVGAGVGVAGLGRADPKAEPQLFSASLDYAAPPACPGSDEFKGVVVKRLGFDPFGDSAPRHVVVSIFERDHGLEGRLEWHDETGKWAGDQTFPVRTNDCAELTRAMALALAVQIHLLATERPLEAGNEASTPDGAIAAPPQKAPPAGSSEHVPTEPDAAAAPRSDAPNARASRWIFELGAGGSLGIDLLPNPTALGRVFGGVTWRALSLELGAELGTRAGARRADGAGFSVHEWLASAALCGNRAPWSACVVAKGGALSVQGTRVDVPASPSGRTFLTGLRLGAREDLTETFFLAERLEALANLTRSTVTLDETPVWRAPPLAGTLGVDVGANFR